MAGNARKSYQFFYLNISRDRLCKALQDRGTSPGLEGSSDSRSARVSLSVCIRDKEYFYMRSVTFYGSDQHMSLYDQNSE